MRANQVAAQKYSLAVCGFVPLGMDTTLNGSMTMAYLPDSYSLMLSKMLKCLGTPEKEDDGVSLQAHCWTVPHGTVYLSRRRTGRLDKPVVTITLINKKG